MIQPQSNISGKSIDQYFEKRFLRAVHRNITTLLLADLIHTAPASTRVWLYGERCCSKRRSGDSGQIRRLVFEKYCDARNLSGNVEKGKVFEFAFTVDDERCSATINNTKIISTAGTSGEQVPDSLVNRLQNSTIKGGTISDFWGDSQSLLFDKDYDLIWVSSFNQIR